MKNSSTTGEIFRNAEENLSRLFTARDINNLISKFWLVGGSNGVIRVKNLFRGQVTLWLLKKVELVRFTFFVPDSVRDLVHVYSELLLADASHLLNCRGHLFPRTMAVGNDHLGRSILHVPIPSEIKARFCCDCRHDGHAAFNG